MTSKHRHSSTQTAVVAGTIDTDVPAAIAAHEAKYHAPPPSTYTFQDEFDTLSPKWVPLFGPGDPGDRLDTDMGNFGLTQVSVANSILTIACERKATPSGRPFASACISTYGTFAQKYGTFEARLRYDEAPGTWPSLFLLPQGQKGPYPEIDWVEAYGDPACLGPGQLEHVVYKATAGASAYKIVPAASGWHTHKMVWTAGSLIFSIDGVETWRAPDSSWVPQVAMYPIFIWGVGANDPNCRASAATPSRLTMDIDWFRVSA